MSYLIEKVDIKTSSGDKKQANNGMSPSGMKPYGDTIWSHIDYVASFVQKTLFPVCLDVILIIWEDLMNSL